MAIKSSRCELSFSSLSIVDRTCLSRFARGNRNRLRREVLRKSVVAATGVDTLINFDRIDRIRHTRLRSRPMRNTTRGMRKVDWGRELVVITRRVLYRRAVPVHAGLVYAGPFIQRTHGATLVYYYHNQVILDNSAAPGHSAETDLPYS